MSEEQRQSSKLLESRSFDMCKNAATPMIAMLCHSELDIEVSDAEVSDADIELTESNDCRGMSRSDGNANSVLSITQKGARFFAKMNGSLLTYLPSQSVDCVR